jgi:ribosomal-protein-alanine N-acetyltransferase
MLGTNLRGLVLHHGDVTLRPLRVRDTAALDRELMLNRGWLRPWEATNPDGFLSFDTKANIRALIAYARTGAGIAFAIEVAGELVGQLNVSAITHGSLSSAQMGYWVAQRVAGQHGQRLADALGRQAADQLRAQGADAYLAAAPVA